MVAAVELRPLGCVLQPVIRAAVHNEHVVIKLGRQRGGFSMRQRKEDHVVIRQFGSRGGRQDPIGELWQLRLVLTEPRARILMCGDGSYHQLRVL
jgi:hypothetical protein